MSSTQRGSIYLGVAGGLFVVSGALVGAYFMLGNDARAESGRAPAPKLDPAAAAAVNAPEALAAKVAALLDDPVDVMVAGEAVPMRWSDLGVVVDEDELAHAAALVPVEGDALAALRAAGALPLEVDRMAAIAALTALKGHSDRAAVDARLDLENRVIRAEEPGFGIDVYASLPAIEAAARAGAAKVDLIGVAMPARVTKSDLGIEDISQVLGTWESKFSIYEKDRNFNLKLAASQIDGHVIPAGGDFSFNEVVGERSEKKGYRIAGVISAGEMIDGEAGGTCQISSTLFGASFFAGLDITETRNHSRPSAYMPLAFDSTVSWPNLDLKLHNAYDFPVAIRFVVGNGVAKAEILGKKRPYRQIAFERHIIATNDYRIEERPDSTIPVGYTLVDQAGFPGYRVTRHRLFYVEGSDEPVRDDRWVMTYDPVIEYHRVGTNPDTTLPAPKEKDHHLPRTPGTGTGRMEQ